MVALQHFLADIAGIGAQAPFVHAPVRAKSEPAFGDLKIAPAAQITAVRSFGEIAAIGPSAGHCSLRAHPSYDNHLKTSEPLRAAALAGLKRGILVSTGALPGEQEYTGRHLTERELAATARIGY